MGAFGPIEETWRTLGGILQIVGVIVIAFGILKLREELDPERSLLAAARRLLGSAKTKLRMGALDFATGVRRGAKSLWRRLRGRRPVQVYIGTANITEMNDVVTAHGTVSAPQDWPTMTIEEKLQDLHRLVRAERDRTRRLGGTVARHRAELDAAIDETRQHVRSLHLGGLSVEAWGAQLLVAGLVMGTWPSWVATSTAMQAGFLAWALLGIGLWATSRERRWWRPSQGRDS